MVDLTDYSLFYVWLYMVEYIHSMKIWLIFTHKIIFLSQLIEKFGLFLEIFQNKNLKVDSKSGIFRINLEGCEAILLDFKKRRNSPFFWITLYLLNQVLFSFFLVSWNVSYCIVLEFMYKKFQLSCSIKWRRYGYSWITLYLFRYLISSEICI